MPPAEPADPRGDLAALAAQTASLVRWCRRYRLLAGTGDATVRARTVTVPQPDAVPEPAAGTDSLEAVAAEVAACRRCHLGETRKNAVPGEGAAPATLMVIGEGPGATEDATGRPFVGEAGQMLTRMLENVLKLPRRQVFIANIVKCRPPNNREPAPDEAEACAGFLRRQVALVRPRAILCLGKIAAPPSAGGDHAHLGPARDEEVLERRGRLPHLPPGVSAAELRDEAQGDGGPAVSEGVSRGGGRAVRRGFTALCLAALAIPVAARAAESAGSPPVAADRGVGRLA